MGKLLISYAVKTLDWRDSTKIDRNTPYGSMPNNEVKIPGTGVSVRAPIRGVGYADCIGERASGLRHRIAVLDEAQEKWIRDAVLPFAGINEVMRMDPHYISNAKAWEDLWSLYEHECTERDPVKSGLLTAYDHMGDRVRVVMRENRQSRIVFDGTKAEAGEALGRQLEILAAMDMETQKSMDDWCESVRLAAAEEMQKRYFADLVPCMDDANREEWAKKIVWACRDKTPIEVTAIEYAPQAQEG